MPPQPMGYGGQPQMGAPGYGAPGYGGQMPVAGQTGYGQPMGGGGGYGYGMPPKRSNAKLFIGLGAGAVVLIVAVVAAVLLMSSSDQQQANNVDPAPQDKSASTDADNNSSEVASTTSDDSGTEGSTDATTDGDGTEPEETQEVSFELEVDPNEFLHSGATASTRTQVSAVISEEGIVQVPMRTWIKKDGTEIVAMLKRRPEEKGKVELLTEAGETIEIDRDDLDEVDNDYLNKLTASLPEAVEVKEPGTTPKIADSPVPGNSFLAMPKAASITPDALTPLKLSQHVLLQMPDRAFAPTLENVVLSSDRSVAMVVMNGHVTGQFEEQAWLELIDLRKNKFVGFFPFPAPAAMPFGITADNLGIFSFTSEGIDTAPQLDSWRLENNEIVLENSVVLGKSTHERVFGSGGLAETIGGLAGGIGGDGGSLPDGIAGGMPLSWFFTKFGVINDKTAYLYNSRSLSFMDIESGKVLYTDSVWFLDQPAFSANRKYMAFQPHDPFSSRKGGDKVLVIDCEKLELAGSFDSPEIRSLAFSDDGTKLAVHAQKYARSTIEVLDITTGEWVVEMEIPARPDSIYWSGDKYVVVTAAGFHAILDVFNGFPVARWAAGDTQGTKVTSPIPLGDNVFVRSVDPLGPQAGLLQTVQVPQPDWIDPNLNENMFYIQLKDNDVSIDMSDTDFGILDKPRVRAGIEERIREAGGRVADNARLRVVCSTRPDGQRSVTFVRRRGRREQDEFHTITYKLYLNEISLYEDDVLVKQFRTHSGGISRSSGTLAELQASAEANFKPSPAFFINTDLSLKMIRESAWKEIPTY